MATAGEDFVETDSRVCASRSVHLCMHVHVHVRMCVIFFLVFLLFKSGCKLLNFGLGTQTLVLGKSSKCS